MKIKYIKDQFVQGREEINKEISGVKAEAIEMNSELPFEF